MGAVAKNLELNSEWLSRGAQEVRFFGQTISTGGLRPNQAKVKIIQDMPPPSDIKELYTLIGITKHPVKFTLQQSETTKAMTKLPEKSTKFIWDAPWLAALQKVKDAIINQPVFAFFDLAPPHTPPRPFPPPPLSPPLHPHPPKKIILEVDVVKFGFETVFFSNTVA